MEKRKIDIRNHPDKKLSFKVMWLTDMYERIRAAIPESELSNDKLRDYLLEAYSKRKLLEGRFYNNITKTNKLITIEQFINYYLNGTSILTGYNVLVKNQNESSSVAIDALRYLLDERKKYKKMMQSAEKGSQEYLFYKVLQLTLKILANSYYGILSMGSSAFYNPHIQNSITMSGQDLISVAIYLVEDFVADNEKFKSMDEMFAYVNNICRETYKMENVTVHKSKDDVKQYLINHSECEVDMFLLDKLLSRRTQEELDKIYYKNQLTELMTNTYFKNKLMQICSPKDILEDKDFLAETADILHYDYISTTRFIRISKQIRQASIVTDTDSTFIYLGRTIERLKKITNRTDNDFVMNLAYFLIQLVTVVMARTFDTFTGNSGIPKDYRPIINMKNEFIYSRILTTRNKKNYAGWLKAELGKEIPGMDPKKHLDIKGLSIRKTTVAKTLRESFQNLLVNDILLPDKIDVKKVMQSYNDISSMVEKSIKSGKTEFLLPKSVDPFTAYTYPERMEQVRSVIIWNELEPDSEIVPPENINMIKLVSASKDCPEMQQLKAMAPDKYETVMRTIFEPKPGEMNLSKYGFTEVAIPLDTETVPTYLTPVIDYDKMINANIKNANILLESLGMYCIDDTKRKTNYKSNIIEI